MWRACIFAIAAASTYCASARAAEASIDPILPRDSASTTEIPISLLERIAVDVSPSIDIAGDEQSIDAVAAYAVSKNWRIERIIKTRLNIYFGGRPDIAPVAELFRKLKMGSFGSARNIGIGLNESAYLPTVAPSK